MRGGLYVCLLKASWYIAIPLESRTITIGITYDVCVDHCQWIGNVVGATRFANGTWWQTVPHTAHRIHSHQVGRCAVRGTLLGQGRFGCILGRHRAVLSAHTLVSKRSLKTSLIQSFWIILSIIQKEPNTVILDNTKYYPKGA